MGDEDDDLLRAAEELGIDLSGVRSTDGASTDDSADEDTDTEIEEGEEGQTSDEEETDAGYIEADAEAGAEVNLEDVED
jgi:DNA-directed RNA polymerase subunit beta